MTYFGTTAPRMILLASPDTFQLCLSSCSSSPLSLIFLCPLGGSWPHPSPYTLETSSGRTRLQMLQFTSTFILIISLPSSLPLPQHTYTQPNYPSINSHIFRSTCFLFVGALLWRSLPSSIRDSSSTRVFSQAALNYLNSLA